MQTVRRRVLLAVERRQRLPRENQGDRLVLPLHDELPGFDDFVRVSGTQT